jgi:hypothetical protein
MLGGSMHRGGTASAFPVMAVARLVLLLPAFRQNPSQQTIRMMLLAINLSLCICHSLSFSLCYPFPTFRHLDRLATLRSLSAEPGNLALVSVQRTGCVTRTVGLGYSRSVLILLAGFLSLVAPYWPSTLLAW